MSDRISTARIDRAAAVRRALLTLVARNGLHGASMGAVAKTAGVATGTAYVHYRSKDELILATYLEVKRDLGVAATTGIDNAAAPAVRFRHLWLNVYLHLAQEPDRARFLAQMDASPFAREANGRATATHGDAIMEAADGPDMAELLVALPPVVTFDLGFGPAIRLAAGGTSLDPAGLDRLAAACWRAITRGSEDE